MQTAGSGPESPPTAIFATLPAIASGHPGNLGNKTGPHLGGRTVEPKAEANDFLGRFREVVSDPNNLRIRRVDNAGFIGSHENFSDPYVIMHNGLRVLMGESAYYENFAQILIINRGVHEPQEEYAFEQVLNAIEAPLPMIELGSYWAYYSLWYKSRFPESTVYMCEPEQERLNNGINNFKLNSMAGKFLQGHIGEGGMNLSIIMDEENIDRLGILHADIQGAEEYLFETISELLNQKRIDFLFVSTHSQKLHEFCRKFLLEKDYTIIADADFDNDTFCYDGLIVASAVPDRMKPFDLYSRSRGDRIEVHR